jgi:hypothetical protein
MGGNYFTISTLFVKGGSNLCESADKLFLRDTEFRCSFGDVAVAVTKGSQSVDGPPGCVNIHKRTPYPLGTMAGFRTLYPLIAGQRGDLLAPTPAFVLGQ